jgi:putative membrane protein insertion efficiency factor
MNPVALTLGWMVRGYQRLVSRWTPGMCRFEPTCSQYALASLRRHGMHPGLWMSLRRLSRCHPFHPGGHDPVPMGKVGALHAE